MISKTSKNRTIFKKYLDSLSEDDFIEKVIIPFFSKNGYILYRLNAHGPGEHGKDIIFYRHVPIFYDHEYIIVQAKSEKVTTGNVAKLSQQLIRALRVPFPTKTGTSNRQANYVLFINSKEHSNDVNFEFPYLIDGSNNIKILSQENVIELLFTNDFIPDELKGKIEEYVSLSSDYEQEIRNILTTGEPGNINFLLNKKLIIETRPLSKEIQGLIINFIFHKWNEDRSWAGTVLPMKWLNQYFAYVQKSQFEKLFQVVEEYASSTHSYEAYNDTSEIVKKLTPNQIKSFEERFFDLIGNRALSYNFLKDFPLLYDKLKEFYNSDQISEDKKDICLTIIELIDIITARREKRKVKNIDLQNKKLLERQDKLYKFLGLE